MELTILYSVLLDCEFGLVEAIKVKPDPAESVPPVLSLSRPIIMSLAKVVEPPDAEGFPPKNDVVPLFPMGAGKLGSNGLAVFAPMTPNA